MEMISFPRQGLDGVVYTREELEQKFSDGLAGQIKARLQRITTVTKKESRFIQFLCKHVDFLLIAKPESLERVKKPQTD